MASMSTRFVVRDGANLHTSRTIYTNTSISSRRLQAHLGVFDICMLLVFGSGLYFCALLVYGFLFFCFLLFLECF